MKNNYMSIGVPVKAQQYDRWTSKNFYHDYVEGTDSISKDKNEISSYQYKLKDKFGGTFVDIGDWIVEFPNGEVHVVTNERFKQRFKEVSLFTPDVVANGISMARLVVDIGDCA